MSKTATGSNGNGKVTKESWPPESDDETVAAAIVPASPLLEALKRAGESDLVAIRARIKEIESELETLRLAEKIIDRRINGKTARGGSANSSAGSKVNLEDIANRVFDLITKEGPGKPADIALKMGVAPITVGKAIARQPDWFVKDSYGKVSIAR